MKLSAMGRSGSTQPNKPELFFPTPEPFGIFSAGQFRDTEAIEGQGCPPFRKPPKRATS